MGFTLLYLSLIVLIPLAALVLQDRDARLGRSSGDAVTDPRVVASYRLTLRRVARRRRSINAVFGFVVAWVLVRYRFPGRRLVDALVDLPFALPTAVAGIALTALYAPNGWIGRAARAARASRSAFTPLGVAIALTFIGLPFVVRTLQPVLEDLDAEVEEAAASLGASRWQTFRRVILPDALARRC